MAAGDISTKHMLLIFQDKLDTWMPLEQYEGTLFSSENSFPFWQEAFLGEFLSLCESQE